MAMTLLARRLRAGSYEEVALSLALGLARAMTQLPPDGLEGLLEVLEGEGAERGAEGGGGPWERGRLGRQRARSR